MRDESTAPYLHEGMPVEVTWQQDVPIAMIALEGGPGSNALAHFDTAFFWAERCKNRMVNPRLHDGKEVSAEMQFFNNEYSGLGCFYVYWMPVMALVHPEVRDNKFVQHAKPAVYVGPSREVESDGFGLFWNGTRHFTTSLGCVRPSRARSASKVRRRLVGR